MCPAGGRVVQDKVSCKEASLSTFVDLAVTVDLNGALSIVWDVCAGDVCLREAATAAKRAARCAPVSRAPS